MTIYNKKLIHMNQSIFVVCINFIKILSLALKMKRIFKFKNIMNLYKEHLYNDNICKHYATIYNCYHCNNKYNIKKNNIKNHKKKNRRKKTNNLCICIHYAIKKKCYDCRNHLQ